jgi:hypothetical protein
MEDLQKEAHLDLQKEERLMILAARIKLTPEQDQEIKEILDSGINIEYFLNLSIRHKVLPLVGPHIIRLDHKNTIKLEYKKIINHAYQGNKVKNTLLMEELKAVLTECKQHGVQIIPLKGALLIPMVYQDLGLRISNDLDFLISLKQRKEVSEILHCLGYVPGHFDWAKDQVNAVTDKEAIQWKSQSGNLHPHMKKVDNDFVKYFGIDFSYDVDLKRTFIASNGLIDRVVTEELCGIETPCLNSIDFLIHIAIHLFKEATNVKWVILHQDLNLIKFCDLREYILANQEVFDWNKVAQRSKELEAEEALFYSFYYLDYIFGDQFAQNLLEYLDISDQSFLNRYVSSFEDGQGKTWRKNFNERFFSLSNIDEVKNS